MVRAGFRRCAKRSPTGFRSRLGQAPSPVAAIVSPRPKPEDNPVAGIQTWSKRAMFLWQRQKVQKVLRCLTSKSSPPNPLTLLVPQMAPGDTTVGSTPCWGERQKVGVGQPIPPLLSEIQVATTNAGARTARRLDPRLFGALPLGIFQRIE